MRLLELVRKQKLDAGSEYSQIVRRCQTSKVNDVARLATLMTTLGLSEDDLAVDAAAVDAGVLTRAEALGKTITERPNRVAFLERAEASLQAARDAETKRRREADDCVAELDAARVLAERRLNEIDAATDELKRLKNQHTRLFAESEVL
jgi:hypothetical protein